MYRIDLFQNAMNDDLIIMYYQLIEQFHCHVTASLWAHPMFNE